MNQFEEAINYLNELASEANFFKSKKEVTLNTINEYLDYFQRPELSFKHKIIIAGTAGKGTVCRNIENLLLKQGFTTTTLISPHIQVVTERIRINGKLISKEQFAQTILQIKQTQNKLSTKLSFYEALVLAGIIAGKYSNTDILICEVGLGGRYDATNAIKGKRIVGLTFIGEDHMDILGNLDNIAYEKCGIFTKESIFNVTYEQNYKELLKKETNNNISFIENQGENSNIKLSEQIVSFICKKQIKQDENLQIPARWEKITENIILDGAHSEPRFQSIIKKIEKDSSPKIAIFAMAKNHEPQNFKIIEKYFDEIILTTIDSIRPFWKTPELKKILPDKSITFKNEKEALEYAKKQNKNIYVIGSFYLAGKIRDLYYNPQEIIMKQTEFI